MVSFPTFAKIAYRGEAIVARVLTNDVWVVYAPADPKGKPEEKKMPKKHMKLVRRGDAGKGASVEATQACAL